MTNALKKNNNSSLVYMSLAAVGVILLGSFAAYKFELRRVQTGNPIVAVVDNTVIHQSDLKSLSPDNASNALSLMVDFKLLDAAAAKKKVSVSESEVQQQRRNLTVGLRAKNYAVVAKQLDRTPSGLDMQIQHALMLQKLSAMELTPDPSGMYHARGILIRFDGKYAQTDAAAKLLAGKLQQQIANGASIQTLAKQYSEDSLSAPSGGDLGIIQISGAPNLVKSTPDFQREIALEKIVKTAKPGLLPGGPVHTYFGYWVVQVMSTDRQPLGDKALYQQVVSEWRNAWIARLEPGVMARLRSAAIIEPPLATQPAQSAQHGPIGADLLKTLPNGGTAKPPA